MCKGLQQDQRERLRIKAFYAHLVSSSPPPIHAAYNNNKLADALTLHYLPRINGRSILEIDGSTIRPDSSAFVTLHRVLSSAYSSSEEDDDDGGEARLTTATYVSRARVVVSEGVRFEIYLGEVRVIKGVFRKLERGGGECWEMGCKWDEVAEGVRSAEVAVEAREAVVREKVVAEERRRRRRRRWCREELEEIPEERGEGFDGVSDYAACTCRCNDDDGDDVNEEDDDVIVEMAGGVRWAVDVGIWVACLGVGYLVARASSSSSSKKILRRIFM